MEHVKIKLNDAERFDSVLAGCLSEGGDLEIVTKDEATVDGKGAVMITFTVRLPDGNYARAQAVTTVKNFTDAAALVKIHYKEEM